LIVNNLTLVKISISWRATFYYLEKRKFKSRKVNNGRITALLAIPCLIDELLAKARVISKS